MNILFRTNTFIYKKFYNLTVYLILSLGCFMVLGACISTGTDRARLQRIKSSPNYDSKKGKFVNTIPVIEPPFFKVMKEWTIGSSNYSTPKKPIPIAIRSKDDFKLPPKSGLRITWLGHATALIEIDGKRLLIDPVWSKKISPVPCVGPERFYGFPLAISDLPIIDSVLISHDHYDHLDKSTVKKLAKRFKNIRFIVPLGIGAYLEDWKIPGNDIVELDWWDSAKINQLTITATPARHFSGRSLLLADRDKTLWAGFAIQSPKHRVYYSGDTGMFNGFAEIGKRLGPFDATLIEVGAYNKLWPDMHIGPEQAVKALKEAMGGFLIPVHWATFDLSLHSWTEPVERLLVAAEKGVVRLAVPKPGESIEPANPPKITRWWPNLPWKTAKEDPIVSSGLGKKKNIAPKSRTSAKTKYHHTP